MFLSACVLAMLPSAGPGHQSTALTTADGGKVLFVAMGADGRAKDDSGYVCVWDLSKPELKAVIPGVPAEVLALRATADGKRFVIVAGNEWVAHRIEVWDVATKKRLHKFEGSVYAGSTAAVSPDANWVAHRDFNEKGATRVWNTDTGKRAGDVEKAVAPGTGALAFTADSKRLAVVTPAEYTEFDVATGKRAGGWKPKEPREAVFRERAGWTALLPDGKGFVSVSATGKRRQTYVISATTEKKDWFLGEVWDRASAPVLSPDGRLLIVTVGGRADGAGTYVLKLDADGAPELTELKADDKGPFWGRGRGEKVPAWRAWPMGVVDRNLRFPATESAAVLGFSADGKRLYTAVADRVQTHDVDRRVPKATLFVAAAEKDAAPEWHILTAAGEFVASPAEAEALARSGKAKDAAKVREALGVK